MHPLYPYSQLAMETLLSLTSKRAGEWFKEELRKLGGLEHIMKTVTDCYECICSLNPCLTYWDKSLTDQLSKICRCLRILENVTHMNQQNQKYLLEYGNNMLITTLSTFLRICCHGILKNSAVDMNDRTSEGVIIRECLFSIVKVLINLTHRFGEECKTVSDSDHR
ncbi:hypothetical protein QAD02_020900 [Eretmocerus hayati]|uniref:Uncharacterized protein n=1 Tax=Eretmocerus hayati TaxID=131215 RepID=A0ACC2PRX0_9HYME|nr:hypothetical protein QAD02_020900 [Eretmocerus hayati]